MSFVITVNVYSTVNSEKLKKDAVCKRIKYLIKGVGKEDKTTHTNSHVTQEVYVTRKCISAVVRLKCDLKSIFKLLGFSSWL